MARGVKKKTSTSSTLGVLMANPANVPWIASDTKRVTVMSVENISSVIRIKRRGGGGGGGKRGDKEWSGRGLKGSHYFCHT